MVALVRTACVLGEVHRYKKGQSRHEEAPTKDSWGRDCLV
jgi:hypothetical protein